MASVTWPPLVTAAPISSSVKVARARPGTAAARRPMRVARTGGTGTAVVDIGRSRRGGWRGREPQHPHQPGAGTTSPPSGARPPTAAPRGPPRHAHPPERVPVNFSKERLNLIILVKSAGTL